MNTNPHYRRQFLQRTAAFALATQFPVILRAAPPIDSAEAAAQKAHRELWRRFIDPTWHTFYDHAGLDGKVVSDVIKGLKSQGLVDSPVRCKYGLTAAGQDAAKS